MADQLVLEFTISTAGSTKSPAQAAADLGAVPLYANTTTDPVLGGMFGLTVASDVTAPGVLSAKRTLKLNMTAAVGAPFAPPPFPCRPVGPIPPPVAVPPTLGGLLQDVVPSPTPRPNPPPQPPYAIVDASSQEVIALTTGAPAGAYTSADDVVELGDEVIVLEVDVDLAGAGTTVYPGGTTIVVGQPAPGAPNSFTPSPIDATVAALTKVFQATFPAIGQPIKATVSAPGGGGGAARVSATVATLKPAAIVALYSTSDADTSGVSLDTPIPAGAGARTVSLSYLDSTGAGPFTVVTSLTGKFPAQVALHAGSVDVAVVTGMHVASTGAFSNSVGQITLAELTAPTAVVQPNVDFVEQQDRAQLLLARALVFLPPSYFALTQQGAVSPQLAGDFLVTTGSPLVQATADQTAALAATNTVRFAAQPNVVYGVLHVTPKLLTLTTPYTGLDVNKVDAGNSPRPTNTTARADKQATGAVRVTPSPAAPPSNAALATPVGQFVGTAGTGTPAPPPPVPTVLSSIFTQTLSLALAVPVTPSPITFI